MASRTTAQAVTTALTDVLAAVDVTAGDEETGNQPVNPIEEELGYNRKK